jgi:hypothetical protein
MCYGAIVNIVHGGNEADWNTAPRWKSHGHQAWPIVSGLKQARADPN